MNDCEVSDAYPRPPHYYKLFAISDTSLPPPTLRNFKSFTCFGVNYLLPTKLPLIEEGLRLEHQVNPEESISTKDKLLCLLYSLMASTLQLLRFLEVSSEQLEEKVKDIDCITRNLLFVLNSLRRKQCLHGLVNYLNESTGQRNKAKESFKNTLTDLLRKY